ncbi:MAG TPA: hypothetical protein VFR24_21125 [Candidatus Angelobacter sp.]|nr:hypothetical protein [Candidatus Angelobacter sp.]
MSSNNNRVLSRMGSRQLTQKEMDEVPGGFIPTRLTVFMTGTVSNPDSSIDT